MAVLENMDAPTMEAAPNATSASNLENMPPDLEEVPLNPPRNLRSHVKELIRELAYLKVKLEILSLRSGTLVLNTGV